MPSKQYTFKQLVDERYIAVGFSKFAALAKIHGESGVSMSSMRAAYEGTAVLGPTAEDLATWAFQLHRVELDQLALLKAPSKQVRPLSVLARLRGVSVLDVGTSNDGGRLIIVNAVADNDVTPESIQEALEAYMRSKEAG